MRLLFALVLALLISLVVPAYAATPTTISLPVYFTSQDGTPVAAITMGAAEGSNYATMALYNGDLINVRRITGFQGRNVQGGTKANPNLDLGAGSDGSAGPRGDVVINHDVGDCTVIKNGRKRVLIRACPKSQGGIHIFGPVTFHGKVRRK
jgi:hypothetical protein